MTIDHSKLDFNFAYAYLETLGDTCVSLYERDSVVLADYGIDEDFKDEVETTLEDLRDFQTDEEALGYEMDFREKKDKNADNLRVFVRSFMVRVEDVYPINSGIWFRFGTRGLSQLDDHYLGKVGPRVARMATLYLATLADTGITQLMITALETLSTKFNESLDAFHDAELLRLSLTHQRVEKANKLYALIVKMFNYGKDYWLTRDESKYKAYVIYNTPSGQPELSGEVGSVSGKLLDAITLLVPSNGLISLEHVANPIGTDAQGNFTCANVPIECTKAWASAANHINCVNSLEVITGENTVLNIMIQPGTTPPPPGT